MHFASHTLVGDAQVQKPFLYLAIRRMGSICSKVRLEHAVKRFLLLPPPIFPDQPKRMPIDETERIVPGSPYGESKYILERLLAWLDRAQATLRLPALFQRLRCLHGHRQHHRSRNPYHSADSPGGPPQDAKYRLRRRLPTPDGTSSTIIHVIDLAQAHILALHALEKGSRTYNLGNGHGFSVHDVVEKAHRRDRPPDSHPDRRPPPWRPRCPGRGSAKIRRELGWEPAAADLQQFLETAWQWHLSHPHGYARWAIFRLRPPAFGFSESVRGQN
jgi:UDP-glucose 4-epimerase